MQPITPPRSSMKPRFQTKPWLPYTDVPPPIRPPPSGGLPGLPPPSRDNMPMPPGPPPSWPPSPTGYPMQPNDIPPRWTPRAEDDWEPRTLSGGPPGELPPEPGAAILVAPSSQVGMGSLSSAGPLAGPPGPGAPFVGGANMDEEQLKKMLVAGLMRRNSGGY